MRVISYIDGFNLYYQINEREYPPVGYRWLDVLALSQKIIDQSKLFRDKEVSSLTVKYFTAMIKNSYGDRNKRQRQNVYISALTDHIGKNQLKIITGTYVVRNKTMQLVDDKTKFVKVVNNIEKGSDVNLASNLIHDTYRDNLDAALVVSNDTDYAIPFRLVKKNTSVPIVLAHADTRYANNKLKGYSKETICFGADVLAASQMPDRVGKLTKPEQWK